MRITKSQLKRIIRQEKNRLLEDCGAMHGSENGVQPEPMVTVEPATLIESGDPESRICSWRWKWLLDPWNK